MLRESNIKFIGELVKTWITDLGYEIYRPTNYRNDQILIRLIEVPFSKYKINISDKFTKSRRYITQLEFKKDKIIKVIDIEMDYDLLTIRKQFEFMVLEEINNSEKKLGVEK